MARKFKCDPVVELTELLRASRWDVPENQHAGERLLARCFSADEVDYLFQQPLFKKAVAMIQTVTDVERVAAFGKRVLAERKSPSRSAQQPSP